VDETKNEGRSPSECCAGATAQKPCGPDSAPMSCGCTPTSARRSWPRTVIAAIILLAAVGVGAYSLLASPAPERATTPPEKSGSLPAGSASPAAESPSSAAQPACCGGAAHAAPVPQPSCCGGTAQAAPPPQPSCCGGGASLDPAALPDEPKCGAKPKGCCGQ